MSYLMAIIGAEYLLRLLPIGTHDWYKFVTPEEIQNHLRHNGFELVSLTGLSYIPLLGKWEFSRSTSVNYILHAFKRF